MARKPTSLSGRKAAARAKAASSPSSVEISVPASICRAVARDFKERGITQAGAAKLLNIEPKSVANQVSGNRPFSKKSAKLYAATFGYSEPYLLTGKGTLFKPKDVVPEVQVGEDGRVSITLEQYQSLEKRASMLEQIVTMLNTAGVRVPVEIHLSGNINKLK